MKGKNLKKENTYIYSFATALFWWEMCNVCFISKHGGDSSLDSLLHRKPGSFLKKKSYVMKLIRISSESTFHKNWYQSMGIEVGIPCVCAQLLCPARLFVACGL